MIIRKFFSVLAQRRKDAKIFSERISWRSWRLCARSKTSTNIPYIYLSCASCQKNVCVPTCLVFPPHVQCSESRTCAKSSMRNRASGACLTSNPPLLRQFACWHRPCYHKKVSSNKTRGFSVLALSAYPNNLFGDFI